MSILEEIFAFKKIELVAAKKKQSLSDLESQVKYSSTPIDFKRAIRKVGNSPLKLIAEIKQKSPSKGLLNKNFDPIYLANTYKVNGASAISVLTDNNFFGGSLDILKQVYKMNLGIPLLRKDFIFDEYQILEAKIAGASALLLIVSMLSKTLLEELIFKTNELGLTPLVEVHNITELETALNANAEVIGINNRNLHTFEVDIHTSIELSKLCPDEIILVAESGIHNQNDIAKLSNGNIDAVLVGESLVVSKNISEKVKELAGIKTI